MKRLNKKGFELNAIPQLAIVIVISAVLMGIGAQVISTMQDTSQMQETTATIVRVNDTFTALIGSAVDFSPAALDLDSGGSPHLITCSSVGLHNYSNVDLTVNFTVVGCTAQLLAVPYNNTEFGANYSYSHYSYNMAYNNTQLGLEAQEDFSDWLPTFVVILGGVVVIGLIGRYLVTN